MIGVGSEDDGERLVVAQKEILTLKPMSMLVASLNITINNFKEES